VTPQQDRVVLQSDEILLYSNATFPKNMQIFEMFSMIQTVSKVKLPEGDDAPDLTNVLNDFKAKAKHCLGSNAVIGVQISISTLNMASGNYLVLSCIGHPAVLGTGLENC
jgi:hypothetical protein